MGKREANCPDCGAGFSHRPAKSETLLWKCGSWQNKPKGLAERSANCRVRKLEAEIERLRHYPDAIATIRSKYPEDVFPPDVEAGTTEDRRRARAAAKMARLTCDNIEDLARQAAGAKQE